MSIPPDQDSKKMADAIEPADPSASSPHPDLSNRSAENPDTPPPISRPQKRPRYHHGDLKQALLKAAEELLVEKGNDGLTMRDLSKRIGVSRTAAYHHFKDRTDLLAALASQGLTELYEQGQAVMDNPELSPQQKFKALMFTYVNYATQHPKKYDLMVGNDLWIKHTEPELEELARRAFRAYVGWITEFSEQKVIPSDNPLRTAQLTWATLHGVCRLVTDGIFARKSDMEEIVQYGINLFTQQLDR